MDFPITFFLWLFEWLVLVLEGFRYLVSSDFRNKKRAEWCEQGTSAKIADVLAWFAADLLLIVVISAVALLWYAER